MPNSATPYIAAIQTTGDLEDISWTVEIRPRRRSFGLTVNPGGNLMIAVPPMATPEQVAKFVGEKRRWIREKVEVSRANQPTAPTAKLTDGEGYKFFGAGYSLRLVEAETLSTERRPSWTTWYLNVPRREAEAHGAKPVVDWYKREGTSWAQENAQRWLATGPARLGITGMSAPTVRVTDLGIRRWGVYRHRRHHVDLHWPLFQLPRHLVEYVLIHELVHATRPMGKAHGPHWQRRMSGVLPEWRTLKKELNEKGRHLWFGETERD